MYSIVQHSKGTAKLDTLHDLDRILLSTLVYNIIRSASFSCSVSESIHDIQLLLTH